MPMSLSWPEVATIRPLAIATPANGNRRCPSEGVAVERWCRRISASAQSRNDVARLKTANEIRSAN